MCSYRPIRKLYCSMCECPPDIQAGVGADRVFILARLQAVETLAFDALKLSEASVLFTLTIACHTGM